MNLHYPGERADDFRTTVGRRLAGVGMSRSSVNVDISGGEEITPLHAGNSNNMEGKDARILMAKHVFCFSFNEFGVR